MGNCMHCRNWDIDDQTCRVDWVDQGADIGQADMAIYASASDDHGLVAGLKTGPMFGCVQFQHRPHA